MHQFFELTAVSFILAPRVNDKSHWLHPVLDTAQEASLGVVITASAWGSSQHLRWLTRAPLHSKHFFQDPLPACEPFRFPHNSNKGLSITPEMPFLHISFSSHLHSGHSRSILAGWWVLYSSIPSCCCGRHNLQPNHRMLPAICLPFQNQFSPGGCPGGCPMTSITLTM